MYSAFKKELRLEPYLLYLDNPVFRQALCKFRTSAHSLKIETGRWNKTPCCNRLCELCNLNQVEDEFHFLLVCSKYQDLRAKFIPLYYFNPPVMYKFSTLLSSENVNTIRQLSRYIVYATKRRDQLIEIRNF